MIDLMKHHRRGRGRPRKYDWSNWFRQDSFAMVAGKDYSCTRNSVIQQIRNQASARNLNVRIEEGVEDFVIVFVDR